MKLKSITIQNMHGVSSAKYDFSDIAYLIGSNGAGKSTVLEAIQLALLGYIPGYPKTNESIMKHSNGLQMSVNAVISDGIHDITIVRSWQKTPAVKGTVSIDPVTFDISRIISDIELPIFNFNEFRSMTANKLKEWFINFLPSVAGDIDWVEEFNDALDGKCVDDDAYNELVEEVLSRVNVSERKGVDQVKYVNEVCKELQSFYKGRLSNLDSTIESLVYYDDCEVLDEAEIQSEITKMNATKSEILKAEQLQQNKERYVQQLEKLKSQITEDNPDSETSESKLHNLKNTIEELTKQEDEIKSKLSELSIAKRSKSLISSTKCPFTNKECKELTDMIAETKKECDAIDADIEKYTKESQDILSQISQAKTEYGSIEWGLNAQLKLQNDISSIEWRISDIDKQLAVSNLSTLLEKGELLTLQQIDDRLSDLTNQLSKVAANTKYKQLRDKVTKDKFIADTKVEILKRWAKHTDANGLQNDMMTKPFEELAGKISKYLSDMFGKSVCAKFNLTAKANSFAFGLINEDNSFIDYDYLSSGEKCLYALAMMMCIMNASECDLKLIMIDDMFDHLDDSNADRVFNALKRVSESDKIQFVLAGVKPCNNTDICVEVK